jgi:hypothetical protein
MTMVLGLLVLSQVCERGLHRSAFNASGRVEHSVPQSPCFQQWSSATSSWLVVLVIIFEDRDGVALYSFSRENTVVPSQIRHLMFSQIVLLRAEVERPQHHHLLISRGFN